MSRYNNVGDLSLLWQERSMAHGEDIRDMDTMVNVYNGLLPPEFNDYFNKRMHVHLVNSIRLAWDDLANMAGKAFPLFVRADNDSPTAEARAERLEDVGYGYNRAGRIVGGIEFKTLKKVLAWWLVGCANAVYMTLPDYEFKTPFFTFRDPRTHFPPVGWSPWTQAAPEDALFIYEMSYGELCNRYPEKAAEIRAKYQKARSSTAATTRGATESWAFTVGEYYHKDLWITAIVDDQPIVLAESNVGDSGHPGVMPVVATGLYSASSSMGRSIFADQVSIQAAMARMFSQKLDWYDRTLYPIIFHTPLSGNTVHFGPLAFNEYKTDFMGVQPRLDVVAPAHQIDADQTMAFALGLSKMLNRNPEFLQGAGPADSAKALEQLQKGITSTIRDGIWPCMLEAEPRLYSLAARMDVNIWPNLKKTARGEKRAQAFITDYVPAVHLRGREDSFELEPGLGLAGYQGTLEIIQLYGAELIPEQDAVEQGEWTRDARGTIRRLQGDKLRKILYADLMQKAAAGILMDGAISEILRRVEGHGEDMNDVIEDMRKGGRLTVQPPAAPTGPAGPGAPGEAPGGMGPAVSGVLPALETFRRR